MRLRCINYCYKDGFATMLSIGALKWIKYFGVNGVRDLTWCFKKKRIYPGLTPDKHTKLFKRVRLLKSRNKQAGQEILHCLKGRWNILLLIQIFSYIIRDHPYITSSRYRVGGVGQNMTIDHPAERKEFILRFFEEIENVLVH